MNDFTKKEFAKALESLGVRPGDVLFVHSDLRPFGYPKDLPLNFNAELILQFYFDVISEAIGEEGTLVVPAYFYEYAREGIPFDTEYSPVSKPLGVFSSFINKFPGRVRSASPLQSCAAIGKKAEEICGGDLLIGYGIASPWHRLYLNKAKFLFLGTTLQSMTYVHHIEQLYGVPHLYTKIFTYPVFRNGVQLKGSVVTSVRYLEYGIEYRLQPFQDELLRLHLLQKALLGRGEILIANAADISDVGIQMLTRDPFAFLVKAPAFIPGKIPMDGVTGIGGSKK